MAQKTENNPLVSVTVITYNSSKFVLETLESIKAQTYKNIELIVSDDCSTDNTVEICKEWIEKNRDRFVETHLITTPVNTGIPANKNRALAKSNGEWIKSIAGDDALLPSCITDNFSFIKSNQNVNVVISHTLLYVDNFKQDSFLGKRPLNIDDTFHNKDITSNKQYQLLLRGDRIRTTPTNFIRKGVIKEVGYYDERFPLIEDYPMWLKLTRNGYKIYFLPKETVMHRSSINSVNNYSSEDLFKKAYFRNENLRQIYVYPNLPILERYREKLNYKYAVLLKQHGLLKKNRRNRAIKDLLFRFLNPFSALLFLKRFLRKS